MRKILGFRVLLTIILFLIVYFIMCGTYMEFKQELVIMDNFVSYTAVTMFMFIIVMNIYIKRLEAHND